jgi:hypothetical protein
MIAILAFPISSLLSLENEGDAIAWTDGNDDSDAYPNYGIQDIIADKAYHLFNESEPEKAEFISYWYMWNGADSKEVSFDITHSRPGIYDNFLAWTDDGLEGDYTNYFINNRKGWEVIDAPTYVQTLANRSVENLTAWMMGGMRPGAVEHHKAAYNVGVLSKYVGDMTQYGHTDYSQWDQSVIPKYNPATTTETSYQLYYEAYLWTDVYMNVMIDDFWYREFAPPMPMNGSRLNTATADLARWVNSRGLPPTTMVDHDGSTIKVGANYKTMLDQFIYNWDNDGKHKGVRGFNATLWNLTVENLIAGAENLSAMYEAIYDEAYERFLAYSPDLVVTDWSVNPWPVIANDDVEVNVTVMNRGPTAAKKFDLLLEIGDFNTTRSLQLDPWGTKNVSFYRYRTGTGAFTINVSLDFNLDIAERNESNNLLTTTILPVPEIHGSTISLDHPLMDIRRDARRAIDVRVQNTGNRKDLFRIEASSAHKGVTFELPTEVLIVKPAWSSSATVFLRTPPDLPLGPTTITLRAIGSNSTSELMVPLTVLERTNDPIVVIDGPDWARLEDEIVLDAGRTTDPDDDVLSFLWTVPGFGNLSGPRINVNYTIVGTYHIVLLVDDGNVTVHRDWPVRVYPRVPGNLSTQIASVGVSGITLTWVPWGAGGLVAYWLEARADPGQGPLSERGPFSLRLGPGNTTGRLGRFLPGTKVTISFSVEAMDYGNRTLDTLSARTADLALFEETLKLYIEERWLYLQYKPWVDPEGVRDPLISIERDQGGFVPLDTRKEEMQRTKVRDVIRYQLGSSFGSYRATLTYLWGNETVVPFMLERSVQVVNAPPGLVLSGSNQTFELNENGTCRVSLTLTLDDPMDTLNVTVRWGDGAEEHYLLMTPKEDILFLLLFHNFSAVGDYPFSTSAVDWTGITTWSNNTLTINEYTPIKRIEDEENRLIAIIVAVVVGVFLAIMLVVLGYIGYRFSKKETEVEFDLKDLKGDSERNKVGTGTDFDQRRVLQIPKESIMIRSPPPKEGVADDAPIIKGTITFDEE